MHLETICFSHLYNNASSRFCIEEEAKPPCFLHTREHLHALSSRISFVRIKRTLPRVTFRRRARTVLHVCYFFQVKIVPPDFRCFVVVLFALLVVAGAERCGPCAFAARCEGNAGYRSRFLRSSRVLRGQVSFMPFARTIFQDFVLSCCDLSRPLHFTVSWHLYRVPSSTEVPNMLVLQVATQGDFYSCNEQKMSTRHIQGVV